jgi:hypothetical protein
MNAIRRKQHATNVQYISVDQNFFSASRRLQYNQPVTLHKRRRQNRLHNQPATPIASRPKITQSAGCTAPE